MTAVHCLSAPAIVWNGKERKREEEEGEKREGIVDYQCLKLHFVQCFGRNVNNAIELMAE